MPFTPRRLDLPDFPWDLLSPYAEQARAHPHGLIDLSVGTPVDPVPSVIQRELAANTNTPGYPLTVGTLALRQAYADMCNRRYSTLLGVENVLPSIGSKEMVALLPSLLGFGAGDVVVIPRVAYPTYEVGALLAGCEPVRADGVEEFERVRVAAAAAGKQVAMVWLNSPSNPTGAVLESESLYQSAVWAKQHGILLVNDECYIDLGWDEHPVSLLLPTIAGNDFGGILALHSLSKRSNLAGYRAGFVAGDPRVIAALLQVRKHVGLIVPEPIQRAAVAALEDDAHVQEQKQVYGRRRELAKRALQSAGFKIQHSQAGLYLWATRGEDCWKTVADLAARGVLVAPGAFYGPEGAQFIRMAMTATDEKFSELADRLA